MLNITSPVMEISIPPANSDVKTLAFASRPPMTSSQLT